MRQNVRSRSGGLRLGTWFDPEGLPAFGQARHRDVVSSSSRPCLAIQAPLLSQHGLPLMRGPRQTVAFVSETFGHGVRPDVVNGSLAVRLGCTEPVECEMQDRRSHLASDPASPDPRGDPRRGLDGAEVIEVVAREILLTNRFAVDEHDEREAPGIWSDRATCTPHGPHPLLYPNVGVRLVEGAGVVPWGRICSRLAGGDERGKGFEELIGRAVQLEARSRDVDIQRGIERHARDDTQWRYHTRPQLVRSLAEVAALRTCAGGRWPSAVDRGASQDEAVVVVTGISQPQARPSGG